MRPTPCGCTSALLSGFTGTAVNAVTPLSCLRRPTFSVAPEKVGKKMRWMRIGLYRKPQNESVEKHYSQHTINSLQIYTTAPPAWGQRSHREQLPRKEMAKHSAVEIMGHLHMRRWCRIVALHCKSL